MARNMGFFTDSKDRLVASFALPMLNNAWLKPYGQATDLKINSNNKTLEITVKLHGENSPIRLEVQDYELTQESGKTFVVLKSVTTSREWMTELAKNFLVGKRLDIPPEVSSMLARVL